MDKAVEYLCCKECEKTISKLADNITFFGREDYFQCITDHKGFQSVCLDPFVYKWLGKDTSNIMQMAMKVQLTKNIDILHIDSM